MKSHLDISYETPASRSLTDRMWRPLVFCCMLGMTITILFQSYRHAALEREVVELRTQLDSTQICSCSGSTQLSTSATKNALPLPASSVSSSSPFETSGTPGAIGSVILVQFVNQFVKSEPGYLKEDDLSSNADELNDEKQSLGYSDNIPPDNILTFEELKKILKLVESSNPVSEFDTSKLSDTNRDSEEGDSKTINVDEESNSNDFEIEPEYRDPYQDGWKGSDLDSLYTDEYYNLDLPDYVKDSLRFTDDDDLDIFSGDSSKDNAQPSSLLFKTLRNERQKEADRLSSETISSKRDAEPTGLKRAVRLKRNSS